MPGRPMRKVFCQGNTRAGLRVGKKIPCKMRVIYLQIIHTSVNIMAIKMLRDLKRKIILMKQESNN